MIGTIKYEQWPPRQIGGQHVGTGSPGVRGVHYINDAPTGIEACCAIHRSQFKNRAAVQDMIEWALMSDPVFAKMTED